MPASSDEWKKLLDDVGWKILQQLQQDARLSFAELGRRVGLSTPAVLERVRRMEDSGIILGYHAELDAAKVGMPITAFIRISVVGELLQRIIRYRREPGRSSGMPPRHRHGLGCYQ